MAVDMNMKILVADDYKSMRVIMRGLLTQLNFQNIDEAGDGGAALNMLREKQYGLVISDWGMEPVSGLELLQEIRADGALKDMPFIMVTAESKPENIAAAEKAGVSNFIVKPFSADTLRSKIVSVLGEF